MQIHTASSCSTQRSALKQVKEEAHLVCNWLLPMDAHSTKPQIAAPPTPTCSPGSGVGFPASWRGGAQAEVARESPTPPGVYPPRVLLWKAPGTASPCPRHRMGLSGQWGSCYWEQGDWGRALSCWEDPWSAFYRFCRERGPRTSLPPEWECRGTWGLKERPLGLTDTRRGIPQLSCSS